MFVLSLMEDTVSIKPHELKQELDSVIRRQLNSRLANKIVPDVGLCICLYDLISVGVSYLLPGNGNAHTRVKFQFIVFRPFIGEVIEAKVITSSKLGLTLSVDFFEEIFVPAHRLPTPHVFDDADQVWYWEFATEEGEPPAKLFMDPGKVVRFRVVDNIFKDVKPDLTEDEAKNEKSYEIIGSMQENGLGCTAWWTQGDEDEEVEDEGDADEEMQE